MDTSADHGRGARLRRHVVHNAIGYLALFVALGGTASAAVIVTSNSQVGPGVIAGSRATSPTTDNIIDGTIGPADLAPGSVTKAKIGRGAVDSTRIADDGVRAADLAPGAVTSDKLGDGQVGLAKLGSDVEQRMDWSGGSGDSNLWTMGDFLVDAICLSSTPDQLFLAVGNNSTTDTATVSRSDAMSGPGGGPANPEIAVVSIDPQGAVPIGQVVSNGAAQGTMVFRLPTETVVASYQASNDDGGTCAMHGTLYRAIG